MEFSGKKRKFNKCELPNHQGAKVRAAFCVCLLECKFDSRHFSLISIWWAGFCFLPFIRKSRKFLEPSWKRLRLTGDMTLKCLTTSQPILKWIISNKTNLNKFEQNFKKICNWEPESSGSIGSTTWSIMNNSIFTEEDSLEMYRAKRVVHN